MGWFSVEVSSDLIPLAETSVRKQGGFVLHVVKRTLLAGDFRKLFLTLWYPGTQLKLISQRKCSKDIESQKSVVMIIESISAAVTNSLERIIDAS